MVRVAITGATGFLGSNIAEVLHGAGVDTVALTRRVPEVAMPWEHIVVDTSCEDHMATALEGCDAVVHTAIANDFQRLDAEAAYRAYPGLTQSVARAAVRVGAKPVYISTDWVMDGQGHLVAESSYGRPVNTYGFLKALGEQAIRDIAPNTGVICRIGGVMGSHRLQASMPRSQDVGFGYFVASIVEALSREEEFLVYSGDGVNQVATPSLAAEIGATIARIVDRQATGCFHVVADDAIGRMDLARLTCEVFGLPQELLREGEPPESERFTEPVPIDTSLGNQRLHDDLGIGEVGIRRLLESLREEKDGQLHPVTRL